jgi:hypothetical protein
MPAKAAAGWGPTSSRVGFGAQPRLDWRPRRVGTGPPARDDARPAGAAWGDGAPQAPAWGSGRSPV